MLTQVKTLFLDKPEELEDKLNTWLAQNVDVEMHMVYLYPVVRDNKNSIMAVIIYQKEGWR